MTDATALLEKLAAGPKPYTVVVRYKSGKVREIPCISDKAAANCAEREGRKIGKDLIDAKGNTVRVVSVAVTK